MFNRHQVVFIFLLVAAAFILNGCCTLGVGTCIQTDTIKLAGTAQLNACGSDHKSHPVAVRFFPLKETKVFLNASFEDLWSDGAGTLGGDLIDGYREFFVAPGSVETAALTRSEKATAIGMLINFCAEEDINSRRYLFPLKGKSLEKTVNLYGIKFSVE